MTTQTSWHGPSWIVLVVMLDGVGFSDRGSRRWALGLGTREAVIPFCLPLVGLYRILIG